MSYQEMPPVEVVRGAEGAELSSATEQESSPLAPAAAGVLWILALVMLACAPAVIAFVWRWAL